MLGDRQFTQEQAQQMYRVLYAVCNNAPDTEIPPTNPYEWTLWIAGRQARKVLDWIDSTPETKPEVESE